jgi:hypothetical protein
MTRREVSSSRWQSLVAAVAIGLVTACQPGVGAGPTSTVAPDGVASIELTPATSTITVGATQAYAAVARGANGDTLVGVSFEWASSLPEVATISPGAKGRIATGISAGTTMITASAGGVTSNAAALTVVGPGAGGVPLDCGGRATTVYGWEGTVSWSHKDERAGNSDSSGPGFHVTVTLDHSVGLSVRADDVEVFGPFTATWWASRMGGSVSVNDVEVTPEAPSFDDFARGSGAPLMEGSRGRFSSFALTVVPECKYWFDVVAYVAGVEGGGTTVVNQFVHAGSLAVRDRPITDADLTLSGNEPFRAWAGAGGCTAEEEAFALGGLAGLILHHGFGTCGDREVTVSWRFTPILTPPGSG